MNGIMYRDRREAGWKLAKALSSYAGQPNVVVLGLPRGGIPVAYEVAKALGAPLDVFVVRKLGVPGYPELAMGAIASGGARIINDDVVASLDIADEAIERVALREEEEIAKQEEIYRGARPRMSLTGKAIILVDDGLATGATMRAAVSALRENRPKKIVVAVPTAPAEVCAAFDDIVDETICLTTPRFFMGVGDVYRDFSQTTNQEVREMLEDAGEKEEASWPNV